MSIFTLPVFEADADPHHRSAMSDDEVYARLEPPKTIVVKFGYLKWVGEFPHEGTAKPGCGSKLVARTTRGTEIVEMLTTTCSNSGCGKSISRREMLDYIENSGGRDYPFHQKGRILRVATIEDLNKQSGLEAVKKECVKAAKAHILELGLKMKLVEAEPILGGEQITFYYMSEERIDFRDLVQRLASQFQTRIEMRQVGARDEARLVADYERCGQHCCCKNFLKVLKPVSMRSAKVQKATLDPLKISGRCGRLMCCLRYEDQTYKELKANLPSRNKRVGTSEGPGVVVDSKILVQLVLVRLEHNSKEIAVPVEELMDPDKCPRPRDGSSHEGGHPSFESDPLRGLSEEELEDRADQGRRSSGKDDRRGRGRRSPQQRQEGYRRRSQELEPDHQTQPDSGSAAPPPAEAAPSGTPGQADGTQQPKSRRRRRRRRRRGAGGGGPDSGAGGGPDPGGSGPPSSGGGDSGSG
ncbi:MAG: hypothetical protein L0Y44_02110 [Phycisphaerales bacterium]|nr:hypothetical protein [Phycisphaerales bacterium]MCI0677367.1 hypothetical protein [Phycisphaerales bacterium]